MGVPVFAGALLMLLSGTSVAVNDVTCVVLLTRRVLQVPAGSGPLSLHLSSRLPPPHLFLDFLLKSVSLQHRENR
jgi:hypothetical protein